MVFSEDKLCCGGDFFSVEFGYFVCVFSGSKTGEFVSVFWGGDFFASF